MKSQSYFILLVAALVSSCNTIYSEKNEKLFEDMMWFQKEIVNFKPEIEDTTLTYQIELTLSHFYQVKIPNFPVLVQITSPSGVKTAFQENLIFLDEKEATLSNCGGDYCDLTQTVKTGLKFKEKGLYEIEIVQPQAVVKGITSLRLALKKD